MRAAHITSYGLDAIHLTDLDIPEPGPREVRVRIEAASINPADWHLATGNPRFMRLSEGLFRPKQPIVGTDGAGVIDAVGAEVTEWAEGDRVFGILRGSFAEYAVAPVDRLARVPHGVEAPVAAALPIAGVTALQAIERGEVAGKRVVVNGASGGVGHLAVQIANAHGAAEVIAVCSDRNAEWVRALGATRVVDYAADDFTEISCDVVIDCIGNRSANEICRGLVKGGSWILLGAHKKTGLFGPLGSYASAKIGSALRGRRCVVLIAKETTDRLTRLVSLVDDGAVHVHIAASRPLSELRDAFDRIESRRTPGKLVVIPHRMSVIDGREAALCGAGAA